MAIELFSENSGMGMSPRISFSHDLCQTDNNNGVLIEQRRPSMDSASSIDFDFHVRESFEQDNSSSADELFSDGKIRPLQIKRSKSKKTTIFSSKRMDFQSESLPPPPPLPLPLPNAVDDDEEAIGNGNSKFDPKQSSKSFWRFNRSSSCGSGYGRSLCPLPLMSRSNSTGSSTSSVKRSSSHNHKQNSQKHSSASSSSTMKSSQSSSSSSSSASYQKPPLKKNYGSYGSTSGVHIFNPVLHVPSASLFGFGSIFSNGKVKSSKNK